MSKLYSVFTQVPGYLLDHPVLLVVGGLLAVACLAAALRAPKG